MDNGNGAVTISDGILAVKIEMIKCASLQMELENILNDIMSDIQIQNKKC